MAFLVGASAEQSEINVTPLIDVLLVLLILFMVIVPVTPRGLDSQVPQMARSASAAALGPVSLRILAGVRPATVRYELEGEAVEPARLGEALGARLRIRADRSVYVSAGPEVSFGVVAETVSVASAAGALGSGPRKAVKRPADRVA